MKRTLLLILGVVMVIWLTACGGNDNDPEDETNNSSDNEVESNNEDGSNNDNAAADDGDKEEITLRMAWWGEQTRNDGTNEVIEMFEDENPHITIETEYASWDDYWRKLAPQAAANELPDIIQMDLSYISQYAGNNQLADLTPYLDEQIDTSEFDENTISGGEVDDGIYGFNLGVNAVGFQYNAELLDEIGVGPLPDDWTWDDYVELADEVADEGLVFDTGMQPDVFFNYYLRTHGERLYSEDGDGLGYEDDQLFVDFFEMLYERVEAESTPTPDTLAQQSGQEDSDVVKETGIGVWQWSNQFAGVQQVADFPLEFHPMPGPNVEDGIYLKPSMFFSIAENSEHKEAAAEFIDFFVNDIEANKAMLAERGVPGSAKVKEELKSEVSEDQEKIFEYVEWAEEHSTPMGAPDPAEAGEIIELLENISEEIMYGQISAEEGAEKFRTDAEKIFSE